jgi:hypothetical protein
MRAPGERERQLVHQFHLILDSFVGLRERDVDSVEELVQVREWALALENLCTQLYECDIPVPIESVRLMEEIGREVGVEDRYRNILRHA